MQKLPKLHTIKASLIEAMIDGISSTMDMHLHAVVDIPGRIDLALLKKSLFNLFLQEPVIGARFLRKRSHCEWAIDPNPPWIIEEFTAGTLQEALQKENSLIAQYCGHLNELPVSLHLIHMPDHDRLIARINHLMADGGGIKNFMYRLSAVYRQQHKEPDWSALPGQPGPRGYGRLIKAFKISRILPIIRGIISDQLSLKPKPGFFVPIADKKEFSDGHVALLHIDADRLFYLKNKWKEENVTVNDLLIAALSQALYTCFGSIPNQHQEMSFVVASDLRQYLPPEDHICNISSLRLIDLDLPAQYAPHEYVLHVAEKTGAWKRNYTGIGMGFMALLASPFIPHHFMRRIMEKSLDLGRDDASNIAFTNIGIIDETKLNFGTGPGMYARITPPISKPPRLTAAVTGCAGALTFSFCYWQSVMKREAAELLIEEVDRQLRILG